MKNLDLNSIGVQEMDAARMKEIDGGWILAFIAGAIVGGMIYDVYKAASLALIDVQSNHPEYYDGPVHSQRKNAGQILPLFDCASIFLYL